MPNPVLDNGVAALEHARRITLGLAEGVPSDQRCHQPIPGCNHVLWVLGHLANTDDLFLSTLANKEPALPEQYRTLFGMGSKPAAGGAGYPSYEELLAALAERRAALIGWFQSLSPDQRAEALPSDLSTFAPNHGALAGSIAWHEGLHAGQITMIRKSLGIQPAFG